MLVVALLGLLVGGETFLRFECSNVVHRTFLLVVKPPCFSRTKYTVYPWSSSWTKRI